MRAEHRHSRLLVAAIAVALLALSTSSDMARAQSADAEWKNLIG
jgi:hypothetical protein